MNIHFISIQSLFCGAFLASKRGQKHRFSGSVPQSRERGKTLRCGQKVPFSGNERFVVVSRPPLPAACSPSDEEHLVPVEVPAAFLSGLEAEETQPLQMRRPKRPSLAGKIGIVAIIMREQNNLTRGLIESDVGTCYNSFNSGLIIAVR